MKKNFLTLSILFLSLTISFKTSAQFGLGFHISYLNWITNEGKTEDGKGTGFYSPASGSGLGIDGYYAFNKKMKVDVSFDFAGTLDRQTSNLIFPGTSNPSYVFVNVMTPSYLLHADFQYAFVNNFNEKGFAFYGLGGAALNKYYYTTNYGVTIPDGKGGTIKNTSADQKKNFYGVAFNLGVGSEYTINNTSHVFLEVRACTGQRADFSSDKLANFDLVPNNFNPASIEASIGMRFNIGKMKE